MPQKITATNARRDFFEIVKGATEKHEVYRVQHRKGSVVILSEDEYDSLIETLTLLSIPGFSDRLKKSIEQMHNGETVSIEDVFRDS